MPPQGYRFVSPYFLVLLLTGIACTAMAQEEDLLRGYLTYVPMAPDYQGGGAVNQTDWIEDGITRSFDNQFNDGIGIGYEAGRGFYDVDGDGDLDFCREVGGPVDYRLKCTLFDKKSLRFVQDILSPTLGTGYSGGRGWGDVNGDGTADYCRWVGDGAGLMAWCALFNTQTMNWTTDSGTLWQRTSPPHPEAQQISLASEWERDRITHWVDQNNDGLMDLCTAVDSKVRCLRSANIGTPEGTFEATGVYNLNLGDGWWDGRAFVDFNGDNLLDYCRVGGSAPASYVAYCSVFEPGGPSGFTFGQGYVGDIGGGGYEAGRAWVDYNGDGLADYCRFVGNDGSDGGAMCLVSTGSGFGSDYTSFNLTSFWNGYERDRRWADVNGDGLADPCTLIGNRPYFSDPGASYQVVCTLSRSDSPDPHSGFGTHLRIPIEGDVNGEENAMFVVDVNEDGVADIVRVSTGRCQWSLEANKSWYSRNDDCSSPVDLRNEQFKNACRFHDLCYNSDGETKSYCDTEFLNRMNDTCTDGNCFIDAQIYYGAVAHTPEGSHAYNSGQAWADTHCYDERADLAVPMMKSDFFVPGNDFEISIPIGVDDLPEHVPPNDDCITPGVPCPSSNPRGRAVGVTIHVEATAGALLEPGVTRPDWDSVQDKYTCNSAHCLLWNTSNNEWVDVVIPIDENAPASITVTVTAIGNNDPDGSNDVYTISLVANDTDGDNIPDSWDNCTAVANANQRDTDADNIGNECDADVNNPDGVDDCMVNFLDLLVYRQNFFMTGDFDTDNNGDNITNFLDLMVARDQFFAAPGPSASGCN